MSGKASSDALERSRDEKRKSMRSRVERAVSLLSEQGRKASFYAVEKLSGVSRSTLYRVPELRDIVERARDSRLSAPAARETIEFLIARIEHLAEENQRLRDELAEIAPTYGDMFILDGVSVEHESCVAHAA